MDRGHGCRAFLDRQEGEVDIDRQARHVPHEQIDGRTPLERETLLLHDKRQDADKEGYLFAIKVSERRSIAVGTPNWPASKAENFANCTANRPRSVDRTLSPVAISRKREYFEERPETCRDFGL